MSRTGSSVDACVTAERSDARGSISRAGGSSENTIASPACTVAGTVDEADIALAGASTASEGSVNGSSIDQVSLASLMSMR